MSIDRNPSPSQTLFRCTFEDTNGDGSVEKSEFEQAKTNNKDLSPGLIKILEETFQANVNDKVTYERLYSFFS